VLPSTFPLSLWEAMFLERPKLSKCGTRRATDLSVDQTLVIAGGDGQSRKTVGLMRPRPPKSFLSCGV